MFNSFYSDCVISDVEYIKQGNASGTYVVSAIIDGRKAKQCVMDKTMYDYFKGLGAGTKNRIWVMEVKKGLIFKGIENEAGERLVSKVSTKGKFDDFFKIPLIFSVGGLVLGIQTNSMSLFYAGLCISAVYLPITISLHKKLANFDTWPAGDVSAYTTAVFGAGLASLKK